MLRFARQRIELLTDRGLSPRPLHFLIGIYGIRSCEKGRPLMCRRLGFAVCVCLLLTFMPCSAAGQNNAGSTEWLVYGADKANTKYSPLDQINRENVSDLKIAWRWNSPANRVMDEIPEPSNKTSIYESTPLMVDGVLHASTNYIQVAAVDGAAGDRTGRSRLTNQPRTTAFYIALPAGGAGCRNNPL